MNTDITKTISTFVESQFPAHYREEADLFVAFVKAYYEYLEENEHNINRDAFTIKDIDTTYDKFVSEFRKKYLDGFPFVSTTDDRFLVKNILDLYRTKGSEESVKLLLRLVFAEDSNVYFPGEDILKASDSLWVQPKYVEVLSSARSTSFVNKEVFGSVSGARAFVDAIVTKRSNNRLIDILYLSDIRGTFVYNDVISDDGVLKDAPIVIGSLSNIAITNRAEDPGGNEVSDYLEIESVFGKNGVASVTSLRKKSTGVDFQIVDGGYGFTNDDLTEIYFSDLIINRDNSNTIFESQTTVTQRIEELLLTPTSTNINLYNSVSVGNTVNGMIANTTQFSATVLEKDTEIISDIINYKLLVQLDSTDTFTKRQDITLTEAVSYEVGTELKESSDYILEVSNTSFTPGETVYQRELVANTGGAEISNTYNFGVVSSVTNTSIEVTLSHGAFSNTINLVGQTSGTTASVTGITLVRDGAEGFISGKTSNTEYQIDVSSVSLFTSNNTVQDTRYGIVTEISAANNVTIDTLEHDGFETSDYTPEKQYYKGLVIDQSDVAIGITSQELEFVYVSGLSVLEDDNGNSLTVTSIDPGTGASFTVGPVTDTETVTLSTDYIGSENIKGVTYPSITINGGGSGVGYVSNVSILSAGSGYSNASVVTISGGGYDGRDPLIPAAASITTDGTGAITAVTVNIIGEGYYTAPTISVADGAGANLSVNMVYGYGFPAKPEGGFTTVIGEVLSSAQFTIGTISELIENFIGGSYQISPFTYVRNDTIRSLYKYDQILTVSNLAGTFIVGETITQANTAAKGTILSYSEIDGIGTMVIRDTSFEENFTISTGDLSGSTSGASADITNVELDTANNVMGDNAIISADVSFKEGVVDTVKIINSGFGYQDGEAVTLLRDDGVRLKGVVSIEQQGIQPGYWKSRSSHLNSEKRLQDSYYYQDFSYDVQTPINIENYRDIVLDLLHSAGTQFFGSVFKSSETQFDVSAESNITQA